MSDLVAKRYVKALLKDKSINEVTSAYKTLKEIASAYKSEKFINIVSSVEVSNTQKVELITSFVESGSDEIKNLIKLLADNKRLNIIPDIACELNKNIAIMTNSYEGVVYSNKSLSDDHIKNISEQFAKKFNITLLLTQKTSDYDGIKVDIDGLGVDISFSKERLKSQMIEHILKAV